MERIVRTRDETLKEREAFFGWIVKDMTREASALDSLFGEASAFDPPNLNEMISEPEHGTLLLPCMAQTEGEPLAFAYSVFHCGSALKIAIMSKDKRLRNILDMDTSSSLISVWQDVKPYEMGRGDWIFVEWGFEDLDVLESYIQQERYVLGLRTLHMRLSSLARRLK